MTSSRQAHPDHVEAGLAFETRVWTAPAVGHVASVTTSAPQINYVTLQ